MLYTDGITEASNPADEEFGEERLMAAVVTRRAAATEAFVSGILADVHGFCAGVRPRDDQTLLVLDSGA